MTQSDYAARKEAKIEHFREMAQKTHTLSESVCDQARKMADVIPFGQPILVGHYSEKRDRNYRDRIWSKFEKAAELEEKAKYYTRRVQAAEAGKLAISSDDPDAIELLKEKLQKCVTFQEHAKQINKIIRKKIPDDEKIAALIASGIKESTARKCLQPDTFGKIGIPTYALTNNNANMKRIKDRIATLEKQSTDASQEYQIGDITIINSVEDNRIMITFPGIPEEAIRSHLKSEGFRWSPSNKAWQAYRSASWKIPGIIEYLSQSPLQVGRGERGVGPEELKKEV